MSFWKKQSDTKRPKKHPGWPELDDKEVEYLIYEANEFIVFLDGDLDVDWLLRKDEFNDPNHNDVLSRVANLECIPNEQQPQNVRLNFKRMVGEGVAFSLRKDYGHAKKILDDAESYIKSRNVERARFWQLVTSLIMGFLSLFLGLVIWFNRSMLYPVFGETIVFFSLSACSGAVGACLSSMLRIGKAQISSEVGRSLHVLEAFSRIFCGALSGLILSLLIQLEIILPITEKSHLSMVTLGFFAGASERWAPTLIAKFEKTLTQSRTEEKT